MFLVCDVMLSQVWRKPPQHCTVGRVSDPRPTIEASEEDRGTGRGVLNLNLEDPDTRRGALNLRFQGGRSSPEMPRTAHCQRWHTLRVGERDRVTWGCVFCWNTLMRVSRKPGEEEYTGVCYDVAPCEKALTT